ncbi:MULTISPECIES: ribosome biogenesis GTPase Der [unclassified Campylobacter]|uniref:ribosome biogenesis GTPase Der n=1 Tax=unclassified Campylobacter TaxID=2593542 RepID=UPI001BDB616A|nr:MULTISPECIES: ribosome biogenesis GTPase Der [unclassified Campylobacter]MBT0880007.1 ribosome biogenesis GTPase Der [Campylobacter sp. 2018MI27]MBT0884482.1 ribosome biogenesis GTPase Der [Campylobacter sp. 2018MI10]
MQKIMLIGKPNVGKSSLFNRLAKERLAITSDISGTTRDTNRKIVDINGKKAILVDSGGLDDKDELFQNVKKNTLKEAKDADIIVYMVDCKLGANDDDKAYFYDLLKLKKPTALVINKVDSKKDEERSLEFTRFGFKNVFNISVSHATGIDELNDFLSSHLRDTFVPDNSELSLEDFLDENIAGEYDEEGINEVSEIDENHIKISILGRVNVGKSSLLNALVNDERCVVSSIAGTTIDPVNESIEYNGKTLEFVDTAGIRRRSKILGIEKYALNRTEKMLENSQIALLVLDAAEGFNELDERIAGLLGKNYLGVIIVLNKWDLCGKSDKEFDEVCKHLRLDRFKFLAYAPIISVSALSKKRIKNLLDLILKVHSNYIQKIQTSKLNQIIEEACLAHPLPHDKGKLVKIYYATQYSVAPPKIALVMNRPKALHFSYKRYLQNVLRKHYDLSGVPLIIAARKKGEKELIEE